MSPGKLGSTRDPTSPTPDRHRQLALHLADLYTHRHTRARRQLRDVLDEGYWRPFREHGIRRQQLGENGADRTTSPSNSRSSVTISPDGCGAAQPGAPR